VRDPAGTRFAEQIARAQALQQQGQLDSARRVYQEILDAESDHFDALNAMGVLAGQAGDLPRALRYFDSAIAVEPGNSGAHCNRGLALKQLRQPDAALACFERAIALDPGSAIAHYSRAETFRELGRADEALASYDAAVAVNPGFMQACYRRGVLLQQSARLDAAIASYDQVIRATPGHFDAHANRAVALFSLGRHAEALAGFERAIVLRPDQAPAYLLRGDVQREMNSLEAALASYDRAIAIDPNYGEAHCSRGTVLLKMDRVESALSSFDRAIAIKPDYALAYYHRAYSLRMLNRLEAAAADYKVLATLAPDFDFLPGARLEASQQVCDWIEFDTLLGDITAGIEDGRQVSHPLILMALVDSPKLHHEAARIWMSHACPPCDSIRPVPRRARRETLRIGYFSADFHEHPVARLLAELIETHDRSRFEVIAFAFGPRTQDEFRQRLVRAFDRFIEVREQSDLEIASLARSLDIDIAVDLGGYSYNSRPKIFAARAAPLQVSYLGYLGTMGASYIDYILADRVLVTPQSQSHFSEKIIYLPDSFQVNDRKRRVADKVFTRGELGLPPSGFVYCCFNNTFKILPATFASWMRILKSVPDSVLLLLAGHEAVERNLRAYAARQGVDPRRLVFAGRLPAAEYLARFRAADLFLDTQPYNAGTTASDALWAGLPVLTLVGEAFAGRVGASLLTAIGLPELITATRQRYEELAIELALEPQRLARIRGRLLDARLSSPLFDTPRFTRNLEAAYTAIHDRYAAGLPPEHQRL
jgi:predicted O-linked N-acetylglucosamine transferase (SPINDLY family)